MVSAYRITTSLAADALAPKADFPATKNSTYLNAAQRHPLSLVCAVAMSEYVAAGLSHADGGVSEVFGLVDSRAAVKFAALIHAEPDEIAYAPSTTAAENMILAAVGMPKAGKNVVTDALHYDGSSYLYDGLSAVGCDVRRAAQHQGAIDYAELERLIDDDTVLVAVSLVSFANGFQHDLPALCRLAHAKGALVYADIIQAVGVIPFDVRASGVDFCASGTHKWLMGDKGVAFLYARSGLVQEGRVARRQFGRRQLASGELEIFVPPDRRLVDYAIVAGTAGMFEVGNLPMEPIVCVDRSIDQVRALGVPAIAEHAVALAEPLRDTLPKLGYPCLSPLSAPGHISAFAVSDKAETARRLKGAGVQVRMMQNFMRVSVSVYNDMADVEKLVRALS